MSYGQSAVNGTTPCAIWSGSARSRSAHEGSEPDRDTPRPDIPPANEWNRTGECSPSARRRGRQRTDAKRASADRKQTKEHPEHYESTISITIAGLVPRPYGPPVTANPVVLTDEDFERLPYGGPHKGM